jgi:hypothetical protein
VISLKENDTIQGVPSFEFQYFTNLIQFWNVGEQFADIVSNNFIIRDNMVEWVMVLGSTLIYFYRFQTCDSCVVVS